MFEDFFGGGLLFLMTVVLWLAYFLPNLMKKQEYLATERNAIRLQNTLKALAETAELPEEIHLELDSRSAAEQDRRLKKQERQRLAAAKSKQAAMRRTLAKQARAVDSGYQLQKRRIRRTRLLSTSVLLMALIGFGLSFTQWSSTGFNAWLLLSASVVLSFSAVLVLARLNLVEKRLNKKQRRISKISGTRASQNSESFAAGLELEEARLWASASDSAAQSQLGADDSRLILSQARLQNQQRAAAAKAKAELAAKKQAAKLNYQAMQAELLAEAKKAENQLRQKQQLSEKAGQELIAKQTRNSAQVGEPSAYASMGLLSAQNSQSKNPGVDIDQVLRRRRRAG